jgi:hypothetical protein
LSGLDTSGVCLPANAWHPKSFFKRLTLSVAFPPDF